LVKADRDRLGQAILNLLTNAIKYSPEANRIDIYVQGDSETVQVQVKDYGIGIEKREQQRIFERFYRVEGRSEQTYPGFGIGLFIAGEIVSRHHGYITVESEKGKGSMFTVTIPVNSEMLNEKSAPVLEIS
jgi:signal transduction histidine kinase